MVKMNQILTTGLLGATLAIGFTGCTGKDLKPKDISLKSESKSYTFIKKDLINAQDIKASILNNLKNKKHLYKRKYSIGRSRIYNNISTDKNNINVDINIKSSLCNSHTKFTKSYTFIESNDKITLVLTNPKNIQFSKGAFYENFVGAKLCMLDGDESKAIKAINYFPEVITLNKKYTFSGEINTKYPDKAIYANFKRILGGFVNWRSWNRESKEKISESKKQNTFALKVNGKSYPLHVEVYPYRNGSKVTYSTTLSYTIDSKGKSTLDVKDIEKARKKIEDIINN